MRMSRTYGKLVPLEAAFWCNGQNRRPLYEHVYAEFTPLNGPKYTSGGWTTSQAIPVS